jgi:hypothetical protein
VKKKRKRTLPSGYFGNPDLAELSDDELLSLRICDLGLKIEGTPLEGRIEHVTRELEAKQIRFRPHYWLSDEWFTPDGVTGIAIPFYLADRRLMRLERSRMQEVEGGTAEWCLRILRHEVVSTPYPRAYVPRPYSRSYVINIEMWYAQAHPVEDFAETFAVWLKPRSSWRQAYENWPALRKLEYVNTLVREIRGKKPLVHSRRHVDPVKSLRKTLGDHYEQRRSYYQVATSEDYDADLLRIFSHGVSKKRRVSASVFLNRIRGRLRREVAESTGLFRYTIDSVLGEMIQRCRELKLRVDRPSRQVERSVLIVLTKHTMRCIEQGEHQISL